MPLNDFQCLIKDPMINKCIQCKPYVAQVARFFLRDISFTLNSAGKLKQEMFFIPRLPRSLIVCIGGVESDGPDEPIEIQEPTGPRVYHQCVSLGKYVYLMGGTGGFNPTNTCCRFHTETMKYEEVSPMHEIRCFLSAVELNGKALRNGRI
ncbi:kelch-like protein 10 [Caerostris extrusa]|uniref:Kelch-like protein 10 n=1 Tax=Caerostris extrusa TaxID=172846 RepID=A0AAV4SGF0_CAEEX|nr:kelch-like protein 10 [Caerostris extrusa]